MTTKSVMRIIWQFVTATFALVGAFFVFYYTVSIILQYSSGDVGPPPLRIVLFLVPFLIMAAAYTWWKRPRKNRVTR